jgi:hypothetical protein
MSPNGNHVQASNDSTPLQKNTRKRFATPITNNFSLTDHSSTTSSPFITIQ